MAETSLSRTKASESDLKAISSKPTCFLILGKPGAGKTQLARRIAVSQRCEYVDWASAIAEEIRNETEIGKKCEDLLLKGEVVPEHLAVEALISKLESNKVAHYGYVLDGLPCKCDDWVSIDEQLAFVQDLRVKPDFVINLRIPDGDLMGRRLGVLVDPETNTSYGKDSHSSADEKGDDDASDVDGSEEISDEDDKEDDDVDAENLRSINKEPIENDPLPVEMLLESVIGRLVKQPTEMATAIKEATQWYKDNVLQKVEDFMAAWDRQKLIELDANQTESEVFRQLVYKLHSMVLHPSYAVHSLVSDDHEGEENEDDEDDVDDDEMLRNLASSNLVAGGYRWRLSQWKRYCPVELKKGNLVKGRTKYSVSFLDKIYCLSSEAALKSFRDDPRFYVAPPQPLIPCKIAVVGPHLSGKTTLARALAEHYNAKLLDPDELVKPLWQAARDEQLAKAREEAINSAIQVVIAAEAAKQAQAQAQAHAQQEDGGIVSEAESSGISLPEITAEHPDVLAAVEKTMAEAEKIETPVTDAMLVEAVKSGIVDVHDTHFKREDKSMPWFGRWVIDGFPRNKEQWLLLSEMKSAMPDDVLWLRDLSPSGRELIMRYREANGVDEGKDRLGEMTGEQQDLSLPPRDALTLEYEKKKSRFDSAWSALSQVIKGSAIDPIPIDVLYKNLSDVTEVIDARFAYAPREYTQEDEQEDEEDVEAQRIEDDENEDENGGDDEEDGNGSEGGALKETKPWGCTKNYCPVALKERGVLWPGSPELACKYREMVYQFSSQEAKEKFMRRPVAYMNPKIPPLRLFLLGAKGSGKTERGRELATKLGIFHVSFRDHLQEILMKKTGKRIEPDEEADPEEEEQAGDNEGIELSEDEAAIKAHLEDGTSLPENLFKEIVSRFWNDEPFKELGFLLEGCPSLPDDVQGLVDAGFYPDCAVLLSMQEGDAVKRLFPEKARAWRKRRDRRIERREEEKRKRQQERAEAREKLKEEKIAQFREQWEAKKRAFEAEHDSEDEDADELPDENVAMQEFLEEEMPEEEDEEEEEEEEETEEDAMSRIQGELAEAFDEESSRVGQILEILDDNRVRHVRINASRKPRIILYSLQKSLKSVIEFRESLFSRCIITDPTTARSLLQSGYKKPSNLGRRCPVALSRGEVAQSQHGPGQASYPIIYGNRVYYMADSAARKTFARNPVCYADADAPGPIVPIRVAILGPPKSGKTTLAKRFEEEYGCVRVSVGSAIRFVLESQTSTGLCNQIVSHLQSGCVVSDDLAMQAVYVRLLDIQCQTRGYVLDGFPCTKNQVDLLTKRKIIPVRVVELEVNEQEVLRRGKKDRDDPKKTLPLHDSDSIHLVRLGCYMSQIGDVRNWYRKTHRNWHSLDATQSKWKQWASIREIALDSVKIIQRYLRRINEDLASCIADLCVTPKECLAGLGEYGQYCPVSLNARGELFDCSVHATLDYTAEWQRKYYRMASASDLDLFLATPEKFCGDGATRKLPDKELLPRRRTAGDVKAMFPKQIELQGYCPVTYLEGSKRYEHLVPGDENLIVEYKKRLFCFATEDSLQKFLRLPEKYSDMKLPKKLPPIRQLVPVASLPMLGFMEQAVADRIIKALTAVGCLKPKHPFVDARKSALLYVGYHLKAFNPKLSEYTRMKYKKKLAAFEEHCQLILYLGQIMSGEYIQPPERPIDFDFKLSKFLALKGETPLVR